MTKAIYVLILLLTNIQTHTMDPKKSPQDTRPVRVKNYPEFWEDRENLKELYQTFIESVLMKKIRKILHAD